MTAVKTLHLLATGERPATGLLHSIRLEARGVEAYGEEAIVDQFRSDPFTISEAARIVEAPGHIAIFDGSTALVADLYGANIARLWRLGVGHPLDAEQGISVVFDPDLAQSRGDVFMVASDHPELAPNAVDAVVLAGRALLQAGDPQQQDSAFRTRAFAIRAFGRESDGVALFAVYRLTGTPVRESGFAMAAACWRSDERHIVRDRAGEASVLRRPWTPRIGK
jgi:hypothetical protein